MRKDFYYEFYYFRRFCYILWCYSIKVFPLVWHERVQQKMGTTTFIWQIVTWILGNSNVYLLFSSPPHCASSLLEWSCLSSLGFAGNHNCSGSWKNCVCPLMDVSSLWPLDNHNHEEQSRPRVTSPRHLLEVSRRLFSPFYFHEIQFVFPSYYFMTQTRYI